MSWKRTEPKTIRPFFGVSHLEDILEGCNLVIGEKQSSSDLDNFPVEPEDFEQPFSVHLPLKALESARDLPDITDKLTLTVSLRDPMLKRRTILYKCSISGDIPEVLEIPTEEVLDFSHKRELQVRVFIGMEDDIEGHEPGLPKLAGQWVARRIFTVKIPQVLGAFRIKPMTKDEARVHTGYAGALIHVDYESETMLDEISPDRPVAKCYIAEAVFKAAEKASDRKLTDLLMSELISAILWEARDEITQAQSVDEDTPLRSVLDHLSQARAFELDDLKKVLKDPIALRAAVQDCADIVDILGAK